MPADLTNPVFQDETKAREWLEARIWPDGPFCPHCGETPTLLACMGKRIVQVPSNAILAASNSR